MADHESMDYELKPPPAQSRRVTLSSGGITLFWAAGWTALMLWVFASINSQSGGWFDGPEVAAVIAGFGLVVGLAVLGLVAGIAKVAIKNQALRSLVLIVVPLMLLVVAYVAFGS